LSDKFVGKIFVYVDGAAQKNPGPAGIGIIICDEDRNELGRHKEFLAGGNKTNNEAEYQALIKGLELAPNYCVRHAVCFSDSQLVIKQMNREFRIHKPRLRELHQRVRSLESTFEKVEYIHCPQGNSRIRIADRLSKEAIREILAG